DEKRLATHAAKRAHRRVHAAGDQTAGFGEKSGRARKIHQDSEMPEDDASRNAEARRARRERASIFRLARQPPPPTPELRRAGRAIASAAGCRTNSLSPTAWSFARPTWRASCISRIISA